MDRHKMKEAARAAGVPFTGLWLETSGEVLAARSGHRPGDAATRNHAVLSQQLATDRGPHEWHVFDAARGPATSLAAARLLTEYFRT